jgi:hypothetical protein
MFEYIVDDKHDVSHNFQPVNGHTLPYEIREFNTACGGGLLM